MKLEYILMIVTFAVIIIVVLISEHFKEKKGRTGEDKKRLDEIAENLIPDSSSYTTAYAKYTKSHSVGGNTTTYYYHYIVAFKTDSLFIIPIKFGGKEIIPSDGFLLTPENVSKVKKKNWFTFYGMDGKEICSLDVWASNTSNGKYEPLNIQQKEEAEKFKTFIEHFMNSVNHTN